MLKDVVDIKISDKDDGTCAFKLNTLIPFPGLNGNPEGELTGAQSLALLILELVRKYMESEEGKE